MADAAWIDSIIITQHAWDRYALRVGTPTQERIRRHMRKSQRATARQAASIRVGCDPQGTDGDVGRTIYLIAKRGVVFAVAPRRNGTLALVTVMRQRNTFRWSQAAENEEN